jgi:hypothetical protein
VQREQARPRYVGPAGNQRVHQRVRSEEAATDCFPGDLLPQLTTAQPITTSPPPAGSQSKPAVGGRGSGAPSNTTTTFGKPTWAQLRADKLKPQTATSPARSQSHCADAHAPGGLWPPSLGWPPGPPLSKPEAPKYVVPGTAAGARLGRTDFPALFPGRTAPAGPAAATSRVGNPYASAAAPLQPQPPRLPAASSAERHLVTRSSKSLTSMWPGEAAEAVRSVGVGGYADVARQAPPAMEWVESIRPTHSWPRLAGGDGGPEDDIEAGADQWQAAALEELCRSHAWAGRDLVEVRQAI